MRKTNLVAIIIAVVSFAACQKCEQCVQYKVPMTGGNIEQINTEEVCGNGSITDRKDEIIDDVKFDGDSVLYQTYWQCSKSTNG
ncbi:MAG: hypothetical protein MRY83_00150 [Flavobacteriales bacterium]|nr:hypothetical protein [Flavobacteriales bacterium]